MFRRFSSFVLFVFVLSCENPQKGLDQLFPGPGFEKGWSWFGMPTHYSPEDLYDYIDGEAELYLSYGFKELATLTYFWGSADDTFFVVDIYDMGTSLNGFGLYSNYRHPGYRFEDIGTEAIVSDLGIKFYQGRYVVELRTGDGSGKTEKAIRVVAQKISERIDEPAEPPEILAFLPQENRVEKTLRYVAQEMLSQAFLPGGIAARYTVGGREVTGFVVLFDDSEEARGGFEKLKRFFEEAGGDFVSLAELGQDGFGVKTTYHDYVLVSLTGRFLAGAQDLLLPESGVGLVEKIKEHLPVE